MFLLCRSQGAILISYLYYIENFILINFRIDWLQQGSRELFGTVIEDQIYILIDTSASMNPHIQFVKDKVFVLMQV